MAGGDDNVPVEPLVVVTVGATLAGGEVIVGDVVAATGGYDKALREATGITMERVPGCLCLLYGIGRSTMDGTDHGVSKAPKQPSSPQSLGSDHINDGEGEERRATNGDITVATGGDDEAPVAKNVEGHLSGPVLQ